MRRVSRVLCQSAKERTKDMYRLFWGKRHVKRLRGKRQVYRTVVFPAIIPELVGGIRVAIVVSWGIQIVTVLMRTQHGMGQYAGGNIPRYSRNEDDAPGVPGCGPALLELERGMRAWTIHR